MFPVCKAPGPHSSISKEFLHSTILRLKKSLISWNLVNPLLSMNEAWIDECAARLQPMVHQYKPKQHQTFAIEKFRDLIVKTRSCPGNKKISLKKLFVFLFISMILYFYLSQWYCISIYLNDNVFIFISMTLCFFLSQCFTCFFLFQWYCILLFILMILYFFYLNVFSVFFISMLFVFLFISMLFLFLFISTILCLFLSQ